MKFLAASALLSSFILSANCRVVDLSLRQDSYPADFKPNFDSVFSVVIQKPLSTVFPILGTNQGLGAHILLESIASDFEEGAADSVNVDGNLEDAFVRTAAAAPAGQGFPRQHFSYIETIKIIPGLSFLDVVVHLDGTYTWDEARNITLYETSSDKSVVVRKVRRFEEIDGGAATNVSEIINGQCPFLEQPITQSQARTAHQAQMNLYHTLFE
ncbi:hypothetical protein DFH08DRAFT_879660 [Mycena albidolilacea]|uniref:Uncharacterized protein n=1 Tax=Mycena albidolilacea TaxID=1033008 RepID=A0AAD6ZR59_9AGAR|nr:hypothetical protein DFH08DRAFT_879660 [Mycena albidolilacea]